MTKLIMVGLLLLMAVSVLGQTPAAPGTAMIVGPSYSGDVWSFKWGVARQMSKTFWGTAMADFGETIEANTEVIALFPVTKWLSLGPMLGVGADWSDEPGTIGEQIATYMTKSTGGVGTISLSEKIGLAGSAKYTSSFDTETHYDPGWTFSFGGYLRL